LKKVDLSSYDIKLLLDEEEAKKLDGRTLKNIDFSAAKEVLFIVGPEGGISEKEVEDLKNSGFLPISLGPRILRTQVAPLYVMSALSYEWEAKE
jgi:16S rRNA (uracil1498-N3)-methyltransferase